MNDISRRSLLKVFGIAAVAGPLIRFAAADEAPKPDETDLGHIREMWVFSVADNCWFGAFDALLMPIGQRLRVDFKVAAIPTPAEVRQARRDALLVLKEHIRVMHPHEKLVPLPVPHWYTPPDFLQEPPND
jgi:hypothetical protein